jgi:nucleotide-binding universal stress UspA family protein
VIQAYDLPDRAHKDFPDVETELQDRIRKSMLKLVEDHFQAGCRWEIHSRVSYEDAADEIIEYIKDNEIDLTFIGQKYGENRQARYGRKIVGAAASDIFLVPQSRYRTPDPVLCAADFSESSVVAFERAMDIAKAQNGRLHCHFVSDATRAYFPAATQRSTGHDRGRFRKKYARFLEKYGLSPEEVPCRIEVGDAVSDAAEAIYREANRQKAGLVVVGAQGDASKVTTLLGNLCETLRRMEKDMPVMVVKHRLRRRGSRFYSLAPREAQQ